MTLLRLECAHLDSGACLQCREPLRPKMANYLGDKRPWKLLYREIEAVIKEYTTLHKLLVDVGVENWEDFWIVAPTGVKLSIGAGRMI